MDALAAQPVLRAATPGDLADVVRIERECFSDPWSERLFTSLLPEDRVTFEVLDLDGVICGYSVIWRVLDESELANLAVGRLWQGRGYGRRLLESAMRGAASRGAAWMYLEVRESNEAARSLYRGGGFEEIGRRKQYYRKPDEDAIVMRARLAG